MTDQQKKTAKEIVDDIKYRHMLEWISSEILSEFEQALQAERDECDRLSKFVSLSNSQALDLQTLREENARMRETLKFYAKKDQYVRTDFRDRTNYLNNMQVDAGKTAREVLASIPETDKYARLREAEYTSKRCGDCDKWMKTSECPKEFGFEKKPRGPSANQFACDEFAARPEKLDQLQKESEK